MADWNASLYLRFADERTRPARELLARVHLERVGRAVDLGCGPGNSTELIAERWPEAALAGIDTSDDMLATARKRLPDARFEKADVSTWRAEAPVDLLFANAVLQWLPDHERLLPALVAQLAPGGVLAIQMPDNLDEASHVLMRETAAEPDFVGKLGPVAAGRDRLPATDTYYDCLVRAGAAVDIWRTTYHHVLADAAAIVDWVRATGLRPFLDPLASQEQAAFLASYQAKIAKAYPPRADGKVLLAFPRLFVVAARQ